MYYAKDGVTVSAVLDTTHPKKSGLSPVRIRVTFARKRQYYPTGKDLTAEDWAVLSTSRSRTLRDIYRDVESSFNIVRDVVADITTNIGFSFEALNARLKSGDRGTLNAAFRAKIADLNAEDRVGSASVYDNVLKGLERFAGGSIPFDAVSTGWVRKYDRFLRDEGKNTTTIGFHMRHLRAVINEAKRAGIVKESQYPFGRGRYEIQAGEGRKTALTLEQVGKIARYDCGNASTAKYRDYWLFLFLCNGINVADLVKLRYRDIVDGEIRFVRQKTERTARVRKEIRIIITAPMQAIIDRWGAPVSPDSFIFPVLTGKEDAKQRKSKTCDFTKAINARMADVGSALGLGKITTYTARHTFATVLERSGASLSYISESLGHSSLKTTEAYLASFAREEREKNAELLTKF